MAKSDREEPQITDPGQVFTPARPVRPDMFASRHYADLQETFEQSLSEPGRQIVLYGDTGVGKTSLVRYIRDTKEIHMVEVECGMPFEAMVNEALSQAGVDDTQVERIEKTSKQVGVGATLKGVLSGRWGKEWEKSESYRSYPVTIQTALREALEVQGFPVLFIDNFENLRQEDHGKESAVKIAQLMKSFSDKGEVKVVVTGIPEESEALIRLDQATARRTNQIEVPRMPGSELNEILVKGEHKLGMHFDEKARQEIIGFSDGFPYYTHLHALYAARKAKAARLRTIGIKHFDTALAQVIDNSVLEVRNAYRDAAETTGQVKVRKSVMEAIARVNAQEVTFKEIKASFWKLHPKYESMDKLNFINPGLSELVEKYGIVQGRGEEAKRRPHLPICQPPDESLRAPEDVRGIADDLRLRRGDLARAIGGPFPGIPTGVTWVGSPVLTALS